MAKMLVLTAGKDSKGHCCVVRGIGKALCYYGLLSSLLYDRLEAVDYILGAGFSGERMELFF